ncbi:MAG: bifunctional glycosyltransferase family 2/GtrA family protein [Sulfolobales archaeon]
MSVHGYKVLFDSTRKKHVHDNAVIISLPAVREEKTIGNVVRKIREQLGDKAYIVVCVKDEEDPTVKAALESGVDAIVLQPKRGYGLAHLTAMHYGRSRIPNAKTIVMVDADDTYDLSRLHEMVELSLRHRALVIGNRLEKKPSRNAMPTLNYLGNKILSLIFRILFTKHIPDTQSGLKVFPADLLEHLSTNGMEFSTEVIVASLKSGIPIYSVPINYYPRLGSPSKLRRFRDFMRILWFIFRESITRFMLSGVLSLLIAQVILLILLTIGLEKLPSLILSSEVSIWLGFMINDRYYNFLQDKDSYRDFIWRGLKYNSIYVFSIILASGIALLIHNCVDLHLVLANFIASIMIFPLNYFINIRLTWNW